MPAASRVVFLDSHLEVRRHAGVVAGRVFDAPKNVDGVRMHRASVSKGGACNTAKNVEAFRSGWRTAVLGCQPALSYPRRDHAAGGLPAVARSPGDEAHLRAKRYGGQPSPAFMSEGWRRGDSHPRPNIHPRRNLRCVSASEVSFPSSRGGKTAGNPPRKISPSTSEVAVEQPAC